MANFIDEVSIRVKSGRGGNGLISWRREKYVQRGGPNGGDGGNGGSVLIKGDANLNTLQEFRYKRLIKAANGEPGKRQKKHGRNGQDEIMKVPVGTQVFRQDELIADILEKDQTEIVAHGGQGGFGNAHFTSSTRQAPQVAEKGEPSEEYELRLELKLLADVGLVGLPNAGKSTLLSVISNAKPRIADYPFTTLQPNLGVVDVTGHSLLVADIPGLIEGASQGKGLGDDFLRHIERTAVLIQLVDAYSQDPVHDFQTIRRELQDYKVDLSFKPYCLAISKIDGLAKNKLAAIKKKLSKTTKQPIYAISSHDRSGLDELLRDTQKRVLVERQLQQEAAKADDLKQENVLTMQTQDTHWRIIKKSNRWVIKGDKIERFARRTDAENPWGMHRLRDIMYKMGIIQELAKLGAQAEDRIVIGDIELEY